MPGSPATTLTQIELRRHGVETVLLLGPTESVVVADHTKIERVTFIRLFPLSAVGLLIVDAGATS